MFLLLDMIIMSLQRIIESARKLGVPVIMTDPAGREPLVIVSLEQFEAMAGSPQETPSDHAKLAAYSPEPGFSPQVSEIPSEQDVLQQDIYLEDVPPAEAQKVLTDEERFYLEPLEDQNS